MIQDIEISPNSLAQCHDCSTQINKGDIRGYDLNPEHYKSKRYYCLKHTVAHIQEERQHLKDLALKINDMQIETNRVRQGQNQRAKPQAQ